MPPDATSAADLRGAVEARRSLLDDLEAAVANRNIASRAEMLRRVTDLFVTGSERFDDSQRELFDDIMGRLVDEIDQSARAAFGERLATLARAPTGVCRALALDDSIEVAGPLLAHSEAIDDETLITGAKTKSQDHLLAISRRKQLNEGITDVLVERGNQEVVISTVGNSGARFSEFGYTTLVTRSKDDDALAQTVWMRRPEIPRQHLLSLFAEASDAVRQKFEALDRSKTFLVRDMVKQARDKIQTEAREGSAEFAAAQEAVEALHRAGALTEERLREFADAGRFSETALALAFMCDVPIGAVERALVHDHSDQLLVLSKSIGLTWPTAKAVLGVRGKSERGSAENFEHCHGTYSRLKIDTAKTAIKFYRLREQATNPKPIPPGAGHCPGATEDATENQ
jgi:uncharacterized protein (DUF2336 family)